MEMSSIERLLADVAAEATIMTDVQIDKKIAQHTFNQEDQVTNNEIKEAAMHYGAELDDMDAEFLDSAMDQAFLVSAIRSVNLRRQQQQQQPRETVATIAADNLLANDDGQNQVHGQSKGRACGVAKASVHTNDLAEASDHAESNAEGSDLEEDEHDQVLTDMTITSLIEGAHDPEDVHRILGDDTSLIAQTIIMALIEMVRANNQAQVGDNDGSSPSEFEGNSSEPESSSSESGANSSESNAVQEENDAANGEEDLLVAAEPRLKRARGEVDIGAFLAELKPTCSNNGQAANVPVAVGNEGVQTYLREAAIKLVTPRADFCNHLATGTIFETRVRIAGSTKKDAAATLLGVDDDKKNLSTNARIKTAQAIYDLIVTHRMHKLRFLNPKNINVVPTLARKCDAIVQYLKGHPEEADWWSNNGEEPGRVWLTNQRGEQVDWPSTQWLLNLP